MKKIISGILILFFMVTVGYCQGSEQRPEQQQVLSIPSVTSLLPSSGPVGTKVTVVGLGFSKDNVVTIENGQGEHAIFSGLRSDDGDTLTFIIPDDIDLPYPMIKGPEGGVIDVPPFHGHTKPGSYEVRIDNRVGGRTSEPVLFEVTQK